MKPAEVDTRYTFSRQTDKCHVWRDNLFLSIPTHVPNLVFLSQLSFAGRGPVPLPPRFLKERFPSSRASGGVRETHNLSIVCVHRSNSDVGIIYLWLSRITALNEPTQYLNLSSPTPDSLNSLSPSHLHFSVGRQIYSEPTFTIASHSGPAPVVSAAHFLPLSPLSSFPFSLFSLFTFNKKKKRKRNFCSIPVLYPLYLFLWCCTRGRYIPWNPYLYLFLSLYCIRCSSWLCANLRYFHCSSSRSLVLYGAIAMHARMDGW